MAKTIIATFADRKEVDKAIKELLGYGFRNDEISVIRGEEELYVGDEPRTKVILESVATGVILGAFTGGTLGFLLGIGVLTIAGAISLMASLPIISNLGLVGIQATTAAGAIYGALFGVIIGFVFGFIASRSEESYETGNALIAVPATGSQEYEVKDIFDEVGATNVKILDLTPYEEEEKYQEYYGTFGLSGTKGGKTKTEKNKRGADNAYDEF